MIERRWLFPFVLCAAGCVEPVVKDRPTPGSVEPLAVAAVPAWIKIGIPVDLRPPEEFARGHLAGAVNLQAGYKQLELRARRFFGASARLCLMAEDPAEAQRLATKVAGSFAEMRFLNARVSDLEASGIKWRRQRTIAPSETAALLASGDALLIDARTAEEYASGHIAGAVLIYPDDAPRQAAFLRPERTVVVICEAGWRSSLVVSWLDRVGFADARNLIGGMVAWRKADKPIERGDEQRSFK
ncbi:MAG: hypothetical protein CMJ85_13370 [Planctomycetes bacterium]|nr:hypothetical protein [Planctomycetota bacterium]